MRSYMLTRMKAMSKMVKDAEEEIPKHYWIDTNQFVKDDIDHFSKRVRLALQNDDVNNSTALKLFWKIRCRLDPSRGECKSPPAVQMQQQKLAKEKQIEEERRKEQERVAAQKRAEEAARKERERIALEQKLEQERLAAEQARLEAERLEREKLEAEKARLEQERIALEQQKVEQERLAEEQRRLEEEKQKLEAQRLALESEKKELEEESRSLWDILFGWIFS